MQIDNENNVWFNGVQCGYVERKKAWIKTPFIREELVSLVKELGYEMNELVEGNEGTGIKIRKEWVGKEIKCPICGVQYVPNWDILDDHNPSAIHCYFCGVTTSAPWIKEYLRFVRKGIRERDDGFYS